MIMFRTISLAVTYIFILLVSGCVIIDGVSPYQKFLNHYGGYVGKPIQLFIGRGPHPISVKQLPNGNFEDEFWLRNESCRFYYEYEPKAGIIVSWRHEGEQSNCFWAP